MPYGNFTANSQNSEANGAGAGQARGHMFDVLVYGTFTGTVQIQTMAPDGTWVQYGANVTAPGAQVIQFASERRARLLVSAFSAGPISWEIQATRTRDRMV